jgi:hypothetical protein
MKTGKPKVAWVRFDAKSPLEFRMGGQVGGEALIA